MTDTLVQAKELHPGKRNSLDALCDRYEVSNSHRKLHGALLDAELLADVFLAMLRGQNSFSIETKDPIKLEVLQEVITTPINQTILVVHLSQAELDAHDLSISGIDKETNGKAIWNHS